MVVVFEDTFDTLDFSKWKFVAKGSLEVKAEEGRLVMRFIGYEGQGACLRTIQKFKLTPYGKATISFSGYKTGINDFGNAFAIISVDGTPLNSYAVDSEGHAIRYYVVEGKPNAVILGKSTSSPLGATFEYDESKNEISIYAEFLGDRAKIASEKWYFQTKEVHVMLLGYVGSQYPEASFYHTKVEALSQSELMFQQFSQLIQSLIPVMFLFMFISMIMSLITTLKKAV